MDEPSRREVPLESRLHVDKFKFIGKHGLNKAKRQSNRTDFSMRSAISVFLVILALHRITTRLNAIKFLSLSRCALLWTRLVSVCMWHYLFRSISLFSNNLLPSIVCRFGSHLGGDGITFIFFFREHFVFVSYYALRTY